MLSSTARALGQCARGASSRRTRTIAVPCASSRRSAATSHRAVPLVVASHRPASSTSRLRSPAEGDARSSAAELHSLYHAQMKEIQDEREGLFGSADDVSEAPDLSRTAKPYFEANGGGERSSSEPPAAPAPSPSRASPPGWTAAHAEEADAARESLYAFSDAERSAWQHQDAAASQIRRVRRLVEDHDAQIAAAANPPPETSDAPAASSSPFSHLTPRGDGARMVDVGRKAVARRVAVARSSVVFPPEVLAAFDVGAAPTELRGPKGPIFETAKIAGILGAKKTSDLIPLCHPLPLDRVAIDIRLVGNEALIECECRVTHRTGVEMEALTGATIAALTIYDMVKAVSHRVEIGPTVLVRKSGGNSGEFVRA